MYLIEWCGAFCSGDAVPDLKEGDGVGMWTQSIVSHSAGEEICRKEGEQVRWRKVKVSRNACVAATS